MDWRSLGAYLDHAGSLALALPVCLLVIALAIIVAAKPGTVVRLWPGSQFTKRGQPQDRPRPRARARSRSRRRAGKKGRS